MKKTNKKGFTLVELVIVIAVIAILAAVLIPVFTNIIGNAKDAAALADARTVYEQYIVDNALKEDLARNIIIEANDTHYYAVVEGAFVTEENSSNVKSYDTLDEAKGAFTLSEGYTWADADSTYKCDMYFAVKSGN